MGIKKDRVNWNLNLLFDGDESPDIEKERISTEFAFKVFIDKWRKREDYLKNSEALKEALDDYESLMRKHGTFSKANFYFFLRSDTDMDNASVKAKYNQVKEIGKKLSNDIQFFSLGISKISEKEQKKFIDYPGLNRYKHFLEMSFALSRYLLSEKEEKIMSLKQETSHQKWEDLTQSLLAKSEKEVLTDSGEKKKKNFSEIVGLIDSKKKDVRDSAAKALNEIFVDNSDIAEAEINAILANKKVNDEIRGMDRPDLARFLEDDVDPEVVDRLIKTVAERLDISKRYYKLKANLLGVKKLAYHERNVAYGKIENDWTFEKSIDIVQKVFGNLDKEFLDIFIRLIESGQVDVFPKQGKRSGGYCACESISMPTYILLNHNDSLIDVKTLAHEFGHAINMELMKKKLNSLNIGTPKSTAEVASIFMEDFVIQELLKEADEETRLSILMSKLNNDLNSVIRQSVFYSFETELHSEFRKKGYLSKIEIGKIFQKHMASYMGDFVEQSPGSENWWIYVPHFRYFFYVYSYSMGALISKALQSEFKKDKNFMVKITEFFSSGTMDSPKNLFLKLGIDITKKEFWNSGLNEIESLLKETEELAKKLGKI